MVRLPISPLPRLKRKNYENFGEKSKTKEEAWIQDKHRGPACRQAGTKDLPAGRQAQRATEPFDSQRALAQGLQERWLSGMEEEKREQTEKSQNKGI
jgi:hypothetical protein